MGMAKQEASRLEVALIQADLVWQDAAANRERLAGLMDRQPECDLYVLPETFTTGFLGDAGLDAETMDGPSVAWLVDQARSRKAGVCGSLVIADEAGNRRNRMVFAHPDGTVDTYDKRHRFAYGGESEQYAAGETRCVTVFRGWRFDMQICYDLRFPVWCRNDRDFDLQIFVANWPAPRAEHWRTLLRARAIENQSCVIGVNRAGVDGNDIIYPGLSVALDAEGALLAELGAQEGTVRVSLDPDKLVAYRNKFRFLADSDPFRLD